MERWRNRVAVVTGASSGIGDACCRLLVAKGMVVVGLARRQERMEELRASLPEEQQGRFHVVPCDVRNEDEIVGAFARIESEFGGVDVLVNSAGITRPSRITSANNSDDLRAVLDTNVLGTAFCTREAFRSMKRRGVDGHVVLLNSIAGHRVPIVHGMGLNLYPSSKHAITAMAEVLRQEFLLAETKVKISSISPGAVDTDIVPEKQHLPMEFPLLRAEDVADAVLYCIQTPPNVQIFELVIQPMGEQF